MSIYTTYLNCVLILLESGSLVLEKVSPAFISRVKSYRILWHRSWSDIYIIPD